MLTRIWSSILVIGLTVALAVSLAPGGGLAATEAAAATSCESLSSLALPNTTVTSALSVAAGPLAGARGAAAVLPAFCRVAATLKPSSDSDIKVEVWLPAAGWNGKFQAVGNGGWQGSIDQNALAGALRGGYAAAATDTGHTGGAAPLLGHPEKATDFAYRAVHEMTVTAKSIITSFYGDGPKFSYWNGCSAGGKQGLKEAQKYPEDYIGIIAGAPVASWTGRSQQAIWIAQATHKDEGSAILGKFPLIHSAVLAACDSDDGVKDSVIENPMQCKFDPAVLQCKDGDAATCLTAAQVETVRKIYSPVTNPRTKQAIFPGFESGSEIGWTTMGGANPFALGTDLFRYVVFQNPDWDYKTFNFDSDTAATEKAAGDMNAMDPNLKAFFARGGKILQYHGWTDPQSAPRNSVNYYTSVVDSQGGLSKVQESYRLFMAPGMNHCQGGDGPDQFDKLSALEQWVEKGIAPDRLVASHLTNGAVDRTRPLCPYPQVASYKGSGGTDDAANFVCK